MPDPHRVLLVVDVQQGLDAPSYGPRSTPDFEIHVARLLDAWRTAGWPIVHVQHLSTEPDSPLRPERPGVAFKPEAAPRDGEPIVQKHVNAAFVGTALESYLRDRGWSSLVVVGLTTDHCVSSTVRMASDLGFDVVVASDATATFARESPNGRTYSAEDVHAVTLASLDGECANVVPTADLLATMPGV